MDLSLSWYEMSDNPSVWAPGQAIGTSVPKTTVTTVSTPNTPPYSHTLDLESRMIDASTMGLELATAPMQTTVIAGGGRQAVCAPQHLQMVPSKSSRGRGKVFVDPCELAPLKKRRIKLEMLSPDEREKVITKREKNKVAAEKCRVKRRETVQRVRAEYEDYLEANETLEADIRKLKEERRQLQELLDTHHCVLRSPA